MIQKTHGRFSAITSIACYILHFSYELMELAN